MNEIATGLSMLEISLMAVIVVMSILFAIAMRRVLQRVEGPALVYDILLDELTLIKKEREGFECKVNDQADKKHKEDRLLHSIQLARVNDRIEDLRSSLDDSIKLNDEYRILITEIQIKSKSEVTL